MPLLAAVVFLGAFLLFAVEPLAGKLLLPLFGGSAATWIAALLFFQVALLGGYAWADALTRLTPRAQALAHSALLALACAALPLGLSDRAGAALAGAPPGLRVLGVLAAGLGAPFLALSATGPLVQAFRARAAGAAPFRLYALSNLGSLLGLLAYPLAIEPYLGLSRQAQLWSWAFALFSLLCAAAAFRAALPASPDPGADRRPRPAQLDGRSDPLPRSRRFWFLLPLCSSALLSSVTSDLTMNIAPIPLLWALPLAAYLLSFIACFEWPHLYRRALFLPLCAGGIAFFAWQFRYPLRGVHPAWEIGSSLLAFLQCALALHGELVRLRPHPRALTRYYLALAAGSAVGSGLLALAAPAIFRSDLDLGVSALAAAAVLAALLWPEQPRLAGVPLQRALRLALALCIAFVAARLLQRERQVRASTVFLARDFYGSSRVQDEPAARSGDGTLRTLLHGTTEHGAQRQLPGRALEQTGYYGPASGAALALRGLQREGRPLRIGVVGLGAGVLASFCRPGDSFTFYELDPLVVRIAEEQFSFLRACAGHAVVPGDARLTLAARAPQAYNALVVDAFSGDSIPVHLLTAEALALYARHLAPEGIVLLHLSNLFVSLEPIAAAVAAAVGRTAFLIDDEGAPEKDFHPSRWVVVAEGPARVQQLGLWPSPALRLRAAERWRWTDDRSSVWKALY